jgi:hypothetical protein
MRRGRGESAVSCLKARNFHTKKTEEIHEKIPVGTAEALAEK